MRIALYSPTTLLGQEIRKALEPGSQLSGTLDIDQARAFTSDEEEVGNLIDVAGAATRVEPLTGEALTGLDAVVCCEHGLAPAQPLLDAVPEDSGPQILLSVADAPADFGQVLVEGVNLETASAGILVSPTASVMLLAQALSQLDGHGLRASATVLQPASELGQNAMSEVFDQARSLLTFDGNQENQIFSHQVAFSTALAEMGGTDEVRNHQLRRLLAPTDVQASVQTLQAGSFHGVGISLNLQSESPLGAARIAAAIEALGPGWILHPHGEPAPTQSAVEAEQVRVVPGSAVEEDVSWLWLTADNLSRCAARNTVAILEALATTR